MSSIRLQTIQVLKGILLRVPARVYSEVSLTVVGKHFQAKVRFAYRHEFVKNAKLTEEIGYSRAYRHARAFEFQVSDVSVRSAGTHVLEYWTCG